MPLRLPDADDAIGSAHMTDALGNWHLTPTALPKHLLTALDVLVDHFDRKHGGAWDRESVLAYLLLELADVAQELARVAQEDSQ